jgi:hypothetical protein
MKLNAFYRWGLFVFLIVVTVLLINKGLDLKSIGTNVDGAGIGVHFLFFEINDRVPEKSIPSYANGFFVASIVTALAAILIAVSTALRHKTVKTEV